MANFATMFPQPRQTDIHVQKNKRQADGRFASRAVAGPGDMAAAIELLREWRRASGDGQRAIAVHADGSAALHDLALRRVAFYADSLDAALAVAEDRIAWEPMPKVLVPRECRTRKR